ncbi:MAG: M56 family metallopeptidase [Bacteroidetes bacterium]|jgi:TonB family protein|nr:M56 family metallopeptidase [Bacteroidota bacterium]
MEALLNWNLRAALYLLIFAVAYLLFLRRNVSAGFNRFYLLLATILAVVLPFVSFSLFTVRNETVQMAFQLPQIIVGSVAQYDEGITQEQGFGVKAASVFAWISLFFLMLFAVRLVYIFWMIRSNQREKYNEMVLVQLNTDRAPFSFFYWLFVSDKLQQDERFDAVLAHEKAHANRWHSLDVLVFEILQSVFWYHPAWYYLRHEIKSMHEFEADKLALLHISKPNYQKTLLELTAMGGMVLLTNPFNVSLIKKRLLMMNRINGKQPARNWLKILLLLPFLVAVIAIQSCNFATDNIEEVKLEEDKTPAFKQEQTPGEEVFTQVEVMPEYPGGPTVMMNFLADNINYPEQARRDSIQGRVFVNFVIEKDGTVSNVTILRGIGGGCDEEAKRVVKLMPKWTPGYQRGQAVRVSFNLPIKFMLN